MARRSRAGFRPHLASTSPAEHQQAKELLARLDGTEPTGDRTRDTQV